MGIFVSGPVGALLSLVLYLLSRPLHFSASTLMLVTFLATICRYRAHYQMANQRVSDLCGALVSEVSSDGDGLVEQPIDIETRTSNDAKVDHR